MNNDTEKRKLTPRQVALKICRDMDMESQDEKPLMTRAEERKMYEALESPGDKKALQTYIAYYEAYCKASSYIGLAFKEYEVFADRMIGIFREMEACIQAAQNLQKVYDALKDTHGDAAGAMQKTASSLTFKNADMTAEGGKFRISWKPQLKDEIKELMPLLKLNYAAAKAVVLIVEDFAQRTHTKQFIPWAVQFAIDKTKEDYALRVSPMFSAKDLKRRRADGERVPKDEADLAIYPDYEDIKPDRELVAFTRSEIYRNMGIWEAFMMKNIKPYKDGLRDLSQAEITRILIGEDKK